ncbi:Cytidine/deoxycytidylate deaminase, zinc-binding protein [gamma proteobacterium HdN1]|nr:Cytidine/deoxycytidylate deaminase, zinc-binding protein [gamma proteobacterium HdN1]
MANQELTEDSVATQFSAEDRRWMERALALARQGAEAGEVPVGAVVVRDGEAIGEGFNCPIGTHDPTAHAEICALRAAGRAIENYRLAGATLYVSLEPCAMCAGAIVHARIDRVVYAAMEPKAGAVASTQNFFEQPQLNYRVKAEGGLLNQEAGEQLRTFFKDRRRTKKAQV